MTKPHNSDVDDAFTATPTAASRRVMLARWWALGLTLLLAMGTAGCTASSTDTSSDSVASSETPSESADTPEATDAVEEVVADEPAEDAEPDMTSGQKNALRSAESYLEMSGFSKAGLAQQLSSPAGDGFSKADAMFAVNNVEADWNAEAAESAQNYLDMSSMSKTALIQQLTSSAGEQFTLAEAQYAANKVY